MWREKKWVQTNWKLDDSETNSILFSKEKRGETNIRQIVSVPLDETYIESRVTSYSNIAGL